MSTAADLLRQYQGQIVPRSFNPGFVVLSFLVSFIGAASTLELINRRTSRNGLLNHIYLISAAVTMGGISIWSMHFVGNRAIVLAQDQAELEIVYSSGFTAVSFFLPIIVLLTAFVATGTNNHVYWWRLVGGGTLAGGAICGMHYIGNASIANYTCQYELANVIGSAVIAVVASNVALSMFFLWRAAWTNSWWKRGLSAVLLAGAVSGMHWCAATGTNYRLLRLSENNQFSRNTIVIVVTVLSFSAALIVAGVVVHGTSVARSNANKARQVVLAAAVFDQTGRILVNPDGLLPSEKITDTYIEKTSSDTFSIENPLFQWMFQASRHWNDLSGMIANMTNHLALLPGNGRGRSVRLISENGQLIEHYDVIFRELFCLAAASLASRLKEQLTSVGVLWDEILPTGKPRQYHPRENAGDSCERGESMSVRDPEGGRGSLMFLVRRLEHTSDVEKLEAAGFRFAEIHQVSGIIRSSMQIKSPNLSQTFVNMAMYAEQNTMMEPVVQLGFFGIRACVSGHGFDVLVEKGARNLLPASKLPLERLEPWHIDYIRQYDEMNIRSLQQSLVDASRRQSSRETSFASLLSAAISTLRARINDPVFDEATLSCRTVKVPARSRLNADAAEECTMIVLHLIIPIHYSLNGPDCEFIPLSFFKVHQMVYKNSPHQTAFTQHLHRELAPVIKGKPITMVRPSYQQARREGQPGSRFGIRRQPFTIFNRRKADSYPVDAEGNPIPTEIRRKLSSNGSCHTGSTLKLWSREKSNAKNLSHDTMSERSIASIIGTQNASPFGGILVSQEIKVAVSRIEEADGRQSEDQGLPRSHSVSNSPARGHTRAKTNTDNQFELKSLTKINNDTHAGWSLGSTAVASGSANEVTTFVDELFSSCIERR
ncbi:hypothetical protein F5Y19DRAFT_310077 [Xylariaceae sp. FL1651]|nr:hypothetical protein F5Y19DRAFT_310077 [Xylariaceae sp. FL1651]